MAVTVEKLLKQFEELEDSKKLEFLKKAQAKSMIALPAEPLNEIPRLKAKIGIKRPLTRKDAY
jgi:hypothetical protein